MKRRILELVCVCIAFCPFEMLGQDLHLSQFEASPMHLNPAMTAMFEGDYRTTVHYRNQWRSLADKAFTTSALSFDMPYKKFKLGAFIVNNRAGAGNYNALNFVLSGAYDYAFKNRPHNHIVGGLQLGIIYKSVNLNKLFFENQFTPQNGGSFDPGIGNGELTFDPGILLPETNLGVMYYYSNTHSLLNPFIGFSVFHLLEPNESFYGESNKLPRRYLVHGGVKATITDNIQIAYLGLAMQQTNAKELNNSFYGYYYLNDPDVYVMLGATHRIGIANRDAMVVHTGFKYKNTTYRFSYDVNTSPLKSITRGKGGFELSIIHLFNKTNPNPRTECPRI